MNIRKIIFVIILLVIIGVVITTTGLGSNGNETIKIGVIAPLSGGGAAFGQSYVKGIELALKDINEGASGSIHAQKYEYKLVIEDDGGSPTTAASAAQKLISTDKVKAILTVTGITGNAVKPIAEANKVTHLADTSDPTVGSGEYNFTNSIVPTDEMPGWLTEASVKGVKKLAVLTQVHPGIAPSVNLIKDLAQKYGIEIVFLESFDGNNRDFKTLALKAKQSGADTYFVASYPPALDIVSKDLIALGETNISTYSLFAISPTPEIYNGKWYTDANLVDKKFMERFKAAFPSIRFNVRTAPYGYDNLQMLVGAFEKDIAPNLHLKQITSYEGKVGELTKSAGANSFRSTPAVWMIENGEAKVVKEIVVK